VLAILLVPAVAYAHPEIVSQEPAADAILAEAPQRVRITFNEELEAAFSDVQLYTGQGQRADQGGGGRAADDPHALEVRLPPLAPGIYTVIWQTVGSDGHKVKGHYAFTIAGQQATTAPGTAAPAATAPAPTVVTPATGAAPIDTGGEAAPAIAWPAALLRAAMLLGALATAGGWLIALAVLRPALADQPPAVVAALQAAWRRRLWLLLALLAAATLGFILLSTADLAGDLRASSLGTLLVATRLGQALLARLALLVLMAGLLYAARDWSRRVAVPALALSAALLLTFSLASHAAGQPAPLLPIIADWLHLGATAIWVGGLITLITALATLLRLLPDEQRARPIAGMFLRFSRLALASVVTLTLTGTYAALLHIHTLDLLWSSDYGRALLVKLAVFGVMICIGAYHLLAIKPQLAAQVERGVSAALARRWQLRFLTAVQSEALLALVILGAVGVLTSTAPLAGPVAQAAPPPVPTAPAPTAVPAASPVPGATPGPSPQAAPRPPYTQVQQVDNLQIGLEVAPASLGKNQLIVTLRDANGPPADVQKVQLMLEMLTMDMGSTTVDVAPEGEGRYVAPESWLSMVGNWRVTVVVRRSDADDLKTDFTVPVGE
jgi:copper transport protein